MFVNFLFSSSLSNCAMEPTNNFQCGHCDKDFAFENELKLHFEEHQKNSDPDQQIKCNFCTRDYKDYENHVKTHHAKCHICGKIFQ